MDLNTYKLMHLVGMALVLMSLGARALCLTASPSSPGPCGLWCRS
jgi:hypothetical protein